MIKFHREPSYLDLVIEYVNLLFLGIFIMEAILKIIALGFKYFKHPWNIFDFSVLMLTIISQISERMSFYNSLGSSTSVFRYIYIHFNKVFRAFRIGRLLRLVKRAKSLRVIFNTLIKAIPALANAASLIALMLFIFAILGMNLFCYIRPNEGLD